MIVPFTSYAWNAYAGKFGEPLVRLFVDAPDVAGVAAGLLQRTKGRRVILFQNAALKTFANPADRLQGKYTSLWWPNGIAETKASFQSIINGLVANKADLDMAVFDIETAVSCWNTNADDRAAMYADPRYADLVATGNFPADCRTLNEADAMHFNYGCQVLFNAAIATCLIQPLYSHFPNLAWSNWCDGPITKQDAQNVRDYNGHAAYYAASPAPYYAPCNYGSVNLLANIDARFKTPWWCLAWAANYFRCAYRAKSNAKILPWLGTRRDSNVLDLAHYQELIYHTCCLAGPHLLYFNGDDFSTLSNWRFDNAVSQYVATAKGKVWSKTVTTDLTDYANDQVVVSAARLVDGSTVGRATFKPNVTSAVVTVAGKSFTVKPASGSVGAWFRF